METRVPTREEMLAALEKRQGADAVRKLQAATVAVCGLGGLGSNIAISLARAGVPWNNPAHRRGCGPKRDTGKARAPAGGAWPGP